MVVVVVVVMVERMTTDRGNGCSDGGSRDNRW